jgi:hypothetical protein
MHIGYWWESQRERDHYSFAIRFVILTVRAAHVETESGIAEASPFVVFRANSWFLSLSTPVTQHA